MEEKKLTFGFGIPTCEVCHNRFNCTAKIEKAYIADHHDELNFTVYFPYYPKDGKCPGMIRKRVDIIALRKSFKRELVEAGVENADKLVTIEPRKSRSWKKRA